MAAAQRSPRIVSLEVDRAAWSTVADARLKILEGQRPLLDRLEALLADGGEAATR